MKKEREEKKLIYNASEMREISEKNGPLKLEEHVEETFNQTMKKIMEAATEGKCKAALLMDPFAVDNDEIAGRIKARCQNLGYVVTYHQGFGMMKFQW